MIRAFVRESNRIEGIRREPIEVEIEAHQNFLIKPSISIMDLQVFVSAIQPNAVLRDAVGLDVRVGTHIPPFGGPQIRIKLQEVLDKANSLREAIMRGNRNPVFEVHKAYESIHPFTDGNGRSGRALWLWMMYGHAPLGFLHTWYYQSLDQGREP